MIVMEVCVNGALREQLLREGLQGEEKALSWPLRARLALDVARGLQHLHARRLVHR